MKDGLEELKEKLRLTQSRLEAEREADAYRRQQVCLVQPQKTVQFKIAFNMHLKHIHTRKIYLHI